MPTKSGRIRTPTAATVSIKKPEIAIQKNLSKMSMLKDYVALEIGDYPPFRS
jgi:hypothetical protein